MLKNVLILLLCWLLPLSAAQAAEGEVTRISATTFPLYQILRQITQQVPGIQVDCILPASTGCPHDYAVTPQDMRRLQSCDILVINGLGLEETLLNALNNDTTVHIVDSTSGLSGLLPSGGDDAMSGQHPAGHRHTAVNPHLFASPRRVAALTRAISAQLAQLDPVHAERYEANARSYAQKMEALAQEFAQVGTRLSTARVVAEDDVFAYLAADMGLHITAVLHQQENQQVSASELLHFLQIIRQSGANAILIQTQYPSRIGTMLSRESGLPLLLLDPVISGPENAPLGYYEHIMRQNMRTLEQILGTH